MIGVWVKTSADFLVRYITTFLVGYTASADVFIHWVIWAGHGNKTVNFVLAARLFTQIMFGFVTFQMSNFTTAFKTLFAYRGKTRRGFRT